MLYSLYHPGAQSTMQSALIFAEEGSKKRNFWVHQDGDRKYPLWNEEMWIQISSCLTDQLCLLGWLHILCGF